MVEFTYIKYDILDDHDRLAIITHTSGTLSTCGIADSILTNLAATFTDIDFRLDKAMNRETAHPLTGSINSSHKERLHLAKGILKGLEFFQDHEDAEKAETAAMVLEIFAKYLKKLPNKKKLTYTRAIQNFLEELEASPVFANLASILIAEKVTLLVEAQRHFIDYTRKRAEEEELESSESINDIRAEIHKIIDVLENHIFYQQYLGNTEYEDLTHKLNGRISEIMTIAKSRHSHEEHHDENIETPEEPIQEDDSFTHQGDR